MKVYEYKDYQDYIDNQVSTTKTKSDWVYAKKETIKKISLIKGIAVKNILCHGTRSAGEQKYFLENYPNAYIVGSEISETGKDYPMTVIHDFNKVKKEWVGKFDIVYSNSFDHTITPLETLTVWKNQLNKNGTLFLEYAERQSRCHSADPLDATEKEIEQLIRDSGLVITDEIRDGVKHSGVVYVCKGEMND